MVSSLRSRARVFSLLSFLALASKSSHNESNSSDLKLRIIIVANYRSPHALFQYVVTRVDLLLLVLVFATN